MMIIISGIDSSQKLYYQLIASYPVVLEKKQNLKPSRELTPARKFRASWGMCGNIQLAVRVNYTMNNPLTARSDWSAPSGLDRNTRCGRCGRTGRLKTWTRTTSSTFHTVRQHAARLRCAPAPRPQLRRLLRAAAGGSRSPPDTILRKQPEWVPVLFNQQDLAYCSVCFLLYVLLVWWNVTK